MQNDNTQRMTAESVHRVCQYLWNEGQIAHYSVGRSEMTGETLANVHDVTGEEFYIETNTHGVWFNRGQESVTVEPHHGACHTPEEAADHITRAIHQN